MQPYRAAFVSLAANRTLSVFPLFLFPFFSFLEVIFTLRPSVGNLSLQWQEQDCSPSQEHPMHVLWLPPLPFFLPLADSISLVAARVPCAPSHIFLSPPSEYLVDLFISLFPPSVFFSISFSTCFRFSFNGKYNMTSFPRCSLSSSMSCSGLAVEIVSFHP